MSKEEIRAFVDSMQLDQPPTVEEFHQTVKSAYMDRSTQIYFIWKKLKELYPEVDANKVVREGSWEFGLWQGEQIAEKYGGEQNVGPKEALLGQTSRAGMLVFEQEIVELEDGRAVKHFNCCPHVEALRRLEVPEDQITQFCRDMLGHCDYAICAPFSRVDIDFPTTIADLEGKPCAMTITAKKTADAK